MHRNTDHRGTNQTQGNRDERKTSDDLQVNDRRGNQLDQKNRQEDRRIEGRLN
jgi:hypothetical protein